MRYFKKNNIYELASLRRIAVVFASLLFLFTINAMTQDELSISGTVTYGNASGGDKRPISNVLVMSTDGSPGVKVYTDGLGPTAGQYLLTGFGPGYYVITPSKLGGAIGAISSYDAAMIVQHVLGIKPLTPKQFIIADVSENGKVNSYDAALIVNYVLSGSGFAGHSGHWNFSPVSRTYKAITTTIKDEDYTAVLMGEVSGNWVNTGAKKFENPPSIAADDIWQPNGISVTAPHSVIWTDNEVVVPVIIGGAADKGIISYQFDLRYDPTVIQPQKDPVGLAGTVSRRLTVATNANEPGLLRVAVYGAFPIRQDGVLLNLRFTAVGAAGSVSPVTFERIMFNEGVPTFAVTDGAIEVF